MISGGSQETARHEEAVQNAPAQDNVNETLDRAAESVDTSDNGEAKKDGYENNGDAFDAGDFALDDGATNGGN